MIPYFMMKNKSPLLLDLLSLLLLLLLLLPICILHGIKRAAAAGPSRPLTLPSTGRVFTKGPRDFQIDLPDRSPPRHSLSVPCECVILLTRIFFQIFSWGIIRLSFSFITQTKERRETGTYNITFFYFSIKQFSNPIYKQERKIIKFKNVWKV